MEGVFTAYLVQHNEISEKAKTFGPYLSVNSIAIALHEMTRTTSGSAQESSTASLSLKLVGGFQISIMVLCLCFVPFAKVRCGKTFLMEILG